MENAKVQRCYYFLVYKNIHLVQWILRLFYNRYSFILGSNRVSSYLGKCLWILLWVKIRFLHSVNRGVTSHFFVITVVYKASVFQWSLLLKRKTTYSILGASRKKSALSLCHGCGEWKLALCAADSVLESPLCGGKPPGFKHVVFSEQNVQRISRDGNNLLTLLW